MTDKSYIDVFDPEGICEKCGLCLQQCPVMKMDKQEAVSEMEKIINGDEPRRVLKECTFCFSCNQYCPNGLSPYALIMERLSGQIQSSPNGFPPYVDYVFMHKGDECLSFDIYDQAPDEHKSIVAKWETPPKESEEVLFCGCNGRRMPHAIEHSSILNVLPKYSPRDACCGEVPFRFGDFATFSRNVEITANLFNGLKTDRLICYCGSCASMFKNIWSKYHGTTLPFEVTTLWEWLWEKVQIGALTPQREVGKTIALNDSCYSSELGDGFLDAVRGLHHAVGMEVVELNPNRQDGLCCGVFSAARNNFDAAETEKSRMKKMNQIVESGAKAVSCYCPGCYGSLKDAAEKKNIDTHYALEEILWALGDEVAPGIMEQGRKIQSAMLQKKIMAFMKKAAQ